MTKLEEIKRHRENAIIIQEYFERLVEKDKELCYLENEWESSYWKFLVKINALHHYIERLYEKERNIHVKGKTKDQSKDGTS